MLSRSAKYAPAAKQLMLRRSASKVAASTSATKPTPQQVVDDHVAKLVVAQQEFLSLEQAAVDHIFQVRFIVSELGLRSNSMMART